MQGGIRLDSQHSARPVRILWVADSLAPKAGTEQQLIELARRIDRSRIDLHVAIFDEALPDPTIFPKTATFPVDDIWTAAGAWQLVRMAWYLRSHQIQIVHAFMVKSGIAAVTSGALARTPVVLTSRRDLGYYYTPRWLKTVKVLNRGVNRLTANSEAARKIAAETEGFDSARIDVLYNGVDTTRFYPLDKSATDESAPEEAKFLPKGKKVVGIVANYREVKDLPLFIRAAAHVAAEHDDAVFLLVGQGSLGPELEALATELGIRERVFFTHGRGDVAAWVRHMDVACLTSHSEGFSNSVLEYMATGVPVVAMDVGGIREAVDNGRTGLLVSKRDPFIFSEAILRLLRKPETAESMGRAALVVSRQKFDFKNAVVELEDYYRRLI